VNNDLATLISIEGSNSKSCYNNTLLYAGTTKSGLTGIEVLGTNPNIDLHSNTFSPRGPWLGSGTTKIRNSFTGLLLGISQAQNGNDKSCPILHGALTFIGGQAVLTEAHVSGNTLTLPDDVNDFIFTPTVPVSINAIVGTQASIQPIRFSCTNTNVTFTDSALLQTDGGVSYTGKGAIEFRVYKISSTWYADENHRVAYL
jgi:hypothetical protein